MNIILVDRGSYFIDNILETTDWNIVVLITDDKNKYKDNCRIKNIYSFSEFLEIEDVENIDYEEFMKYKHIQYINEYGFRRIYDDYQLNRFDFYTGLSYWLTIFKKYNVDMTIIADFLHGFRCDYILQEVSKVHNVRTFNIMPSIYNTYIIYDTNNDELLENIDKNNSVKIEQSMFYSNNINYDQFNNMLENFSKIKKVLYKIGGMASIRIVSAIYRRSLKVDLYSRSYSLIEYLINLLKFKWLLKKVEKKYEDINLNDKYIIYFLHFEPEAVITGNMNAMDNQLTVIKLITENLPNGWKLYLKLHPDLFKLNTTSFEYFIPSVNTFNSKMFYDKLLGFKNIKLINHKLNSSELIKNSSAIATMIGTVALEATKYYKPVLLFSAEKNIYKYSNDFFLIKSTNDLRESINKIVNGFLPKYENLDKICNKYLFKNDENGKNTIVETLKKVLYNNRKN